MSTPIADCSTDAINATALIDVELVYARPESVWRHTLRLVSDSTVRDALELSGFFDQFRNYRIDTVTVGIYGQTCALDRQLSHGDRIEVYRELVFDPMESRRRRARHRQNIKH